MAGLKLSIGLVSSFVLAGTSNAIAADSVASREAGEFFETEIRPILVNRCVDCHGPKKQWAGLRLDSRNAMLKGGDSGPAMVPGRPGESELLRRLTEADESLRMPPEEAGSRLTSREIKAFARWVDGGAAWPASAAPPGDGSADRAREHWAFRPVRRPPIPVVQGSGWCRTPIDRFVLQKLETETLAPSPPADRRTLIRRATYDLTGLPPTADEVDAFVSDDAPAAYSRLVDRLLDSPRYGERQARHWLDVARYSDTKGYVYAREERSFVHSASYRDWVIRAFNADLPYDRFVMLQLAADQTGADDPDAPAAMGFLTLGRRFLGVTPDVIDDRIDVTCRGLMGLTVGCARCHDHKYDPIPTADYYSLYGVFQNSAERLVPLPQPGGPFRPTEDYLAGLTERRQKLAESLAASRREAADRIRGRIIDYLLAQRELEKYPEQGFDQVVSKQDLVPAIVRRWNAYLTTAVERGDPIFVPWAAFVAIPDDVFASRAAEVSATLSAATLNPRLAEAFSHPPASFREVAERYGRVFGEVDRSWRELCDTATRENEPLPAALPDPTDEALRQVLYGPQSPCVIPDESIVNIESLFDTETINEQWRLQGEVERWLLQSPPSAPHAVILADRDHVVEPRVFRRGNPANKGEEVPLRFLEVIAGKERPSFTDGSGRLELAEAIVDPTNPLTARVWVNRVWMHHFGEGLVRTPSDFGLRSDPPSHPELLDWLADEFTAGGWSTKSLHRLILNSAAYRQRSDGPVADGRSRAMQVDPENRFLWRMNARRLGYEELRDTLLTVSGELNAAMGGRPVDSFSPESPSLRRSVYGLIDRQFVPGVMRTFDFANPDLHTPQRSETTVPQQALFALNHPFVARSSRALAARLDRDAVSSDEERIERLFRIALQRDPTDAQRTGSKAFIESAAGETAKVNRSAMAAAWTYGYGEPEKHGGKIANFQPLPHFTGTAWQGGTQFPDAALGWVQLTAEGGHPGNDLSHAAVRRWTAPRNGTIAVISTVRHEPAAGDGIRCRIVSSRHGLLASAAVHHGTHTFDVPPIDVQAGGTIDFIADINANLNSDQFLWSSEMRMSGPKRNDSPEASVWNAERDFTGPSVAPLGPWERLAQVLLISNELLFVD